MIVELRQRRFELAALEPDIDVVVARDLDRDAGIVLEPGIVESDVVATLVGRTLRQKADRRKGAILAAAKGDAAVEEPAIPQLLNLQGAARAIAEPDLREFEFIGSGDIDQIGGPGARAI
jgi:hypothetical protein